MQAGKALKTAAAFMLSVAMLATGAACGTSDDSDASASKSSSKSSELTGYDVSGVKKDDAIAKMLPDYVTKDGKLTIGMDTHVNLGPLSDNIFSSLFITDGSIIIRSGKNSLIATVFQNLLQLQRNIQIQLIFRQT